MACEAGEGDEWALSLWVNELWSDGVWEGLLDDSLGVDG